MPQASVAPQTRAHRTRFKRLLLMTGLGLFGLVTLGGWKQERVRALAAGADRAAQMSDWGAGYFPVENFQAYTSAFGYRQSPYDSSSWEFHRGLDIAAPQGSYIRNWWTGTVVGLSDNTLCGTLITIQSGEWKHTYCHMMGHVESVAGGRYLIDREGGIGISVGQQIPAGARIGRVGMTGRTTGPHLHWGLKYAGNYVDPALVLRAMYAQQPGNSQPPAASSELPSQGRSTTSGGQSQKTADY